MANAIKLSIVTGPHRCRRYCFRGATHGIIGRGSVCLVQLSGFERDGLISRKHCFLAVDPPNASIGDLGSVNGTYINGKPLSPIDNGDGAMDQPESPTLFELHDGDIITVGGTTLQIELVHCPHTCGYEPGELPSEEDSETNEDGHNGKFCNWACLYARQSETLEDHNAVVWEE